MIKTIIKHHFLDKLLNSLFDNLINTFKPKEQFEFKKDQHYNELVSTNYRFVECTIIAIHKTAIIIYYAKRIELSTNHAMPFGQCNLLLINDIIDVIE